MSKLKALIMGISGQDGSYLAELLLEKGYEVWGLLPHRHEPNFDNISHLLGQLKLVDGDMTDEASIRNAISKCRPDEIYNLASQSFVAKSWKIPMVTMDINTMGLFRILESCRHLGLPTKIYQASSSEIFGNAPAPQCETTLLAPASPYAISKAAAHHAVCNYRESYGMWVCSGILFNHESARRGSHFVTQKIAKAAAEFSLGLREEPLKLGNLDSRRDWGYAVEFVEAMWLMLQQDEPGDYVIGTGISASVEDFLNECFARVGIEEPKKYIEIDQSLIRPVDVNFLQADITKARRQLKWSPKTNYKALAKIMVDHWVAKLKPQGTL